ncbi:NO-inducible flavohemoprotein [Sporolactobacillus sp. THM7-4]|nr:NO-inducible flavohemoprotein [Sporolactobacillus sp. THM7-4]
MNKETIRVIKSSVPVLESKGEEIVIAFYHHLLETHPELKNIFNRTNQKNLRQPRALATMVYQAAKYIDRLDTLLPAVKEVAEKHRSIGIKPDQYPIVGENLLWAIKYVLKEGATDELLQAWAQAYGEIADIFISVENGLRENMIKKGGWKGFAPFTVEKIVQESDIVKSFYLSPKSEGLLPDYYPGQYISIKVRVPNTPYTQIRQYSLSDAPGGHYFRISVKREEGRGNQPEGLVSNYLHNQLRQGDILEVSAPAGDFSLRPSQKPVVFISGGIGQTPLIAMVKHLVNHDPHKNITWIHSAKDPGKLAFFDEIKEIIDRAEGRLDAYYALSQNVSRNGDIQKRGRIDEDWLKHVIQTTDADYYFCGPLPFMKFIYTVLKSWNVPDSQVHYEFFGPKGALMA